MVWEPPTTKGHATLMHHLADTLAAALAALALAQFTAWRALAAVDPYMWVAIPAVYAWCAAAIRTTLERAGL